MKIIKSSLDDFDTKYIKDYIGKIYVKENKEYIWKYNNYFEKNKFIKSYDELDWVVIGPTKFSSNSYTSKPKHDYSYKLSEGDFIKFGKITFLVRKIKVRINENIKEEKIDKDLNLSCISINNNSNCNIKLFSNINENSAIYNRYENYDVSGSNIVKNNNKLLTSIKTRNYDSAKKTIVTERINNRLKNIYLKIKSVTEKQKTQSFKCRICFCEGSFEGKNPLISPCKCTGSVSYIHLICLRKWLTSKVTKRSLSDNIYCYEFISLECEICKTIIPEIVEYRCKYLSLLDFEDIEPPYLILQSMHHYNLQNKNESNVSNLNMIFIMSFKKKNYLVIGRANDSDLKLNNLTVSHNHSVINYSEDNFYIDDIGSKFGTLLLVQNNILFLPYKEITIQTGLSRLSFILKRTFLGCFKCYPNKKYEKMSYEDNFKTKNKEIYRQIIDNFNNNIVDPLEKYSSVNGSISERQNNDIDKEKDDDKDKEKTERSKTGQNITIANHINSINNYNHIKCDNDIKKIKYSDIKENNRGYGGLMSEHNESKDNILSRVKSNYIKINKGSSKKKKRNIRNFKKEKGSQIPSNGNKNIKKKHVKFGSLMSRKNTIVFHTTRLKKANLRNFQHSNSYRENTNLSQKFYNLNNSYE